MWIGAAGGGVWRSTDAGKTWALKWRASAPLEIGSLAIDPTTPTTLYCGTGEANLSLDSYPGDGVYRSTNGGTTWQPWALSETTGLPRRIGTIAVDPFDSKHVLVGGIGFGRVSSDNDFGGIYRTKNRGTTWQRLSFISANNYWCHSIVFDPVTRGRIFATVTGPGPSSGIYRSNNGGVTWTQLKNGLPATDRIGRTALAIAPSNHNIVYAISADLASDRADNALGVFRSSNGGSSWADVTTTHFRQEGQMSYNCDHRRASNRSESRHLWRRRSAPDDRRRRHVEPHHAVGRGARDIEVRACRPPPGGDASIPAGTGLRGQRRRPGRQRRRRQPLGEPQQRARDQHVLRRGRRPDRRAALRRRCAGQRHHRHEGRPPRHVLRDRRR